MEWKVREAFREMHAVADADGVSSEMDREAVLAYM